MWAEKEMHNLIKMSKFGITVPEVVLLKKHILVKIKFKYISNEMLRHAFNTVAGCYPLQAKWVREVVNLTARKNPHTPVYGVKEFVCLWSTLTIIISGLAKKNGLKKIWEKRMSQHFLFVRKVAGRAGAEGRIRNILTQYMSPPAISTVFPINRLFES